MDQRQKSVYFAKLAEQAARYTEMLDVMKDVAKLNVELTSEERNLLRIGCKNVVDAKRASWRKLSMEEAKGYEVDAKWIAEYRLKVESDLTDTCKDIIALIDDHLVASTSELESYVLYHKMKGDHYRYLAEIKVGNQKEKAAADSMGAYDIGVKAAADLTPTSPVRLSLALNFSVLLNDTLDQPGKALFLAKEAYDEAILKLADLNEESYKESTMILQILIENIKLWSYNLSGD